MRKALLIFSFVIMNLIVQAQSGSVELSSGGFSFIPAFTSKEPNIIINAGTNDSKRLSGHLMYMTRVKSMTPTGIVLMTRYKLIDSKFKASIGIHIPAMQFTEKYEVMSVFGQEMNLSYPVSDKTIIGSFLLHGKGRNSDFEASFASFFTNYHKNKWNSLSQAYYLDLGHLTGVTETVTYDINKHFQMKVLANYTITNKDFISTFGVNYIL